MLTPTRTERSRTAADSASSPMASRIARAARTARSASSSCAAGSPKTAMTSSPMNFSTMPAHALDLLAKDGVVRVEQPADVLGVELIGAARVADLVREEHRDRAALLGQGRLRERYAAGAAEAEADRIVLAAARADEHRAISLACARAAPLPYARAGRRALLPLSLAARGEPRGALAVRRRHEPVQPRDRRPGGRSRSRRFARTGRATTSPAGGGALDPVRGGPVRVGAPAPLRRGAPLRGRAARNDARARGARAPGRRRHDPRLRDPRDAARSPRAAAGGDRPGQDRAPPFRADVSPTTTASPWPKDAVSPSVRRSRRCSSCPAGESVSSGPATRSSDAVSTRR